MNAPDLHQDPKTRVPPRKADRKHRWDNATCPFCSSSISGQRLQDADRRSTRRLWDHN